MTALEPDPLVRQRTCNNCGTPLPRGRRKRFCDGRCRAAAHRARREGRARAILRNLRHIEADLRQLFRGE